MSGLGLISLQSSPPINLAWRKKSGARVIECNHGRLFHHPGPLADLAVLEPASSRGGEESQKVLLSNVGIDSHGRHHRLQTVDSV